MTYPIIVGQAKHQWIIPTLARLPTYLTSPSAINLVTGTGADESQWFQYANQNGGPARGFWNMEPATHDDCWRNFIRYRPDIQKALNEILGGSTPDAGLMSFRIDYAIAMCRVKYFRSPLALPAAGDAAGLSRYHKVAYNSSLGAADPVADLPYYQAAIAA